MTKGRIEVISVLAILLVVLLSFSMLNLVSALPNYQTCNNGQGVLVYASPEISGCDVDCSTCGEKTTIPCSGSPVRSYNECSTSSWNCGKLKVGTNSCVGASEDKFLDLPAGSSSTFLTPLINEGYYYTYGSCNDATYVSAWDSNFRKCVEIFNENGQVKARYHGFFLGDGCSGDDKIVSLSSTEFNKQASKRHYCGGYCQPDYTFYCSNPGVAKTELGCQEDKERCYKGWNDLNKNGASEETAGYCDNGECKNLNFWIESVSPIQVLEGFDWIENKPGMIRVKANFDNKFKPVEQYPDEKEDAKINLILWKLDENSFPFLPTWTKILEKTETGDIKRVYSNVEKKNAKDTVNFFNIKITEPGTYRFEAIADPDNDVIEYKEDDNAGQSVLGTRVQKDEDYKVLVVLVSGIQLPTTGISQAISTAKQNYEFMIRVAAFNPTKTSLDLWNPPKFLSVSVDTARVNNRDAGYIKGIRRKIFSELSKIAAKEKADLVYGMVLNDNLMWDGEVIMRGVRNRGYKNVILIKKSTHAGIAVHELGHIFGLGEDYTDLSYGVLSGSGWALDQSTGGSLGPRLNIWPCPPSGCIMMTDVAEPDPGWVIPPGDTRVGPRYYNIMGNAEYPYLWINQNSYETFLNRLTE